MSSQATPSILHRPSRSTSMVTQENAEKEYAREQDYWQQKSARKAQTEERLRRSLYGRAEEQAAFQQELRVEAERHAAEKAAICQREAAAQQAWQQGRAPAGGAAAARPWTISALSVPEHAADNARRAAQAETAHVNRRMCAERALASQQAQQAERAAVRSEIAGEASFFNFGATNEKWIAPEHRVRRVRTAPSNASALLAAKSADSQAPIPAKAGGMMQTPWHTERGADRAQPAAKHALSARPAAGQHKPQADKAQYPWAWDAEPKR